jgi:hypothetical protein
MKYLEVCDFALSALSSAALFVEYVFQACQLSCL